MEYLLLSVVLFSVIFLLFSIFVAKNFFKKKLSKEEKQKFKKILLSISKLKSHKEQIIEYDKLYHKILLSLGYNGTFGEILKKEPLEIGNLNEVWKLHKTRNKLVHEFDVFKDKELIGLNKNYKKEISSFL